MEYFTLSEDLEKINSAKAKNLRKWTLLVITVLVFFLLRGIGVINLEYSKGYFAGNHEINKEISEISSDTGKAAFSTKNNVITNSNELFYWKLGVGFGIPFLHTQKKIDNYSKDEKRYLEEIITEKFSKDEILSEDFSSAAVTVRKLDMDGLNWFPIVKKGKASYLAIVQNEYSRNTYSAEFFGEIELSVYGFCTNERLKKDIAEEIGKVIVKSVKDDYKK